MIRDKVLQKARRIVIKIGSGVLTKTDDLDRAALNTISDQICRLIDQDREILLVSSGAMAVGVKKLNLKTRPEELPSRQAAAAVGQAGLIMEYEKAFRKNSKAVAQILLSGDGLNQRSRWLNARNTLKQLLMWQVVPVINENDTVTVEEIKFGDNDNLSAVIALLMDAELLINLTDIDGLHSNDPRVDPQAVLLPEIKTITRKIENLASGIPGALGMGGMLGKIKAARKVTRAGIPMLIANGKKPDILLDIFAGVPTGTFFIPQNKKMSNRKCWIGLTLKPKGIIYLDQGAATAVSSDGKSLLPAGITRVEGEFKIGDPVRCMDSHNEVVGAGLVNYSSADIRTIMGHKSNEIKAVLGYKPYDEVIHRDNLTIIS